MGSKQSITPIRSILIANRGEIACRIIRTCRKLGITSVAVHSEADKSALHVKLADKAIALGGFESKDSYLKGDLIIKKAKAAKVDAIHPGYGFLSENSDFARAVKKAGIIFIGPSPATMDAVGDKIRAKALAQKVKVPTVPGVTFKGSSTKNLLKDARTFAKKAGFPVLIKASAGGGGRGMRIVRKEGELEEALASASREAAAFFNDGRIFIEKLVENPRHIEVQLLGSSFGEVIHLLDRDCTMQRRHQKVIEEAPAPNLSSKTRDAILGSAVKLAKAAKYENAGTAEFLLDDKENFYFLEINSRLQVEHPVTEEITGTDLVALQIGIAEGRSLRDLLPTESISNHGIGSAIEVRICAEDPSQGFRPATGEIENLSFPSNDQLRLESGVKSGDIISHYYDPMIAKLIVRGKDRRGAIEALVAALKSSSIVGPASNIPFLLKLLTSHEFLTVQHSTLTAEDLSHEITAWPNLAVLGFALWEMQRYSQHSPDGLIGWRLDGTTQASRWLAVNGSPVKIDLECLGGMEYRCDLEGLREVHLTHRADTSITFVAGGNSHTMCVQHSRSGWHVTYLGQSYKITESAPALKKANARAQVSGPVRIISPLPGKIIGVRAKSGDDVAEGDTLFVLESMKMEHAIRSPRSGRVAKIHANSGEIVDGDAVLAELEEL